ncbi:MAG: hypothetical protein M1823_003567 [Watsoniomyces obsoletus]|nr:MAG: hypothetical protein M1823_003567 [Watsoniomyces obsoletus]
MPSVAASVIFPTELATVLDDDERYSMTRPAAVHYSTPARYVIRDQIRAAFRRGDPAQYDAAAMERTLEFLRNAARSNGMEHRVLKNILQIRWHQQAALRRVV